jgi:hypothetical protein
VLFLLQICIHRDASAILGLHLVEQSLLKRGAVDIGVLWG